MLDYCEKDETNPDILLYRGIFKRLHKRHGKAYDDWAQNKEKLEMIKNDICLQPVPEESASPVKADV